MLGPPFLGSLVRDIATDADDLEVVGEFDREGDWLEQSAQVEADFVIVAVDDPTGDDVQFDLLEQRPLAKVLALAGRGRDAVLWELRPEHNCFGQISPDTLLSAIRSAKPWRVEP